MGNYLETDFDKIVIAAHAVTTIIDIRAAIDPYRSEGDGWLRNVVELLSKRSNHLEAIGYMFGNHFYI